MGLAVRRFRERRSEWNGCAWLPPASVIAPSRPRPKGSPPPAATAAFLHAANELAGCPEVAALRGQLQIVLAEINLYEQCMAECEQQLARWHADDAIVRKLDEVSGIGLLTASALKTMVGQPERFASGRQLSAWLGMTPREYSSGNRRRLGQISCLGNTYVRTRADPRSADRP